MAEENEELEDFLQEVDEISNIVKNLQSKDELIRDDAINKADSKLNECGRIKYDRTVINHDAFKGDFDPPAPCFSLPNLPADDPRKQELFMAEMEKDAKRRAKKKARNESEAKIFIEKGNKEFKAGNYGNAIELYSEAVNLVKDSPSLYTSRAEAYVKHGQFDKAIKDCENILFFNKNDLKALLFKAESLSKLEKFDDAVELYEIASNFYPLERKTIKKLITDLKRSKEIKKKEENVLESLKNGNKNLIEIEECLNKLQPENSKMFTIECNKLVTLITNDEDRTFFRIKNGFQLIFDENKHENEVQMGVWDNVIDVFDVAVKENEENQNFLMSFNGFTQQIQSVLTNQLTRAGKTLNFLHTLSCEESGRRVLVENINSDWLLKTLAQKSSKEVGIEKQCAAILNNMALNENFRLKLEFSFDKILLPKFRILLSDKNVDSTSISYFGNLALSDVYRAKMVKQEQFWVNYVRFLETFNNDQESNVEVVDASLVLAANLSKDPLPESVKTEMKPLIQQLILLVSKQVQVERVYLILSRIINSFEGAVKIVLNLNFLPLLLEIIQDEESPLTPHAIRILVSLTRISKKSQKEVARKSPYLLKLLKSQDENIIGNTALCITNCLAVPKLSAYLTQTEIIENLLSVIKEDEIKPTVKKNAGQLLAKLANAESEHLQQLRKLRGIEILHSCIKFNSI